MNLVDTSVWIDFFRGSPRAEGLRSLLQEDQVLLHPWIHGELALGGLGPRREDVLPQLDWLPAAPCVPDDEVLQLIHARQLSGRGIGWVDAQLLASALVAGAALWTFDGRLAAVAKELEIKSP